MITLALLFALYFLPTIIASHRRHGSAGVFLLNLLFGWTVIGWLALLLYALLLQPRVYAYVPASYHDRRYGGWQRSNGLLAVPHERLSPESLWYTYEVGCRVEQACLAVPPTS